MDRRSSKRTKESSFRRRRPFYAISKSRHVFPVIGRSSAFVRSFLHSSGRSWRWQRQCKPLQGGNCNFGGTTKPPAPKKKVQYGLLNYICQFISGSWFTFFIGAGGFAVALKLQFYLQGLAQVCGSGVGGLEELEEATSKGCGG